MKTILLAILFLAACTTTAPINDGNDLSDDQMGEDITDDMGGMDHGIDDMKVPDWKNIELTDVNSEETYTIGKFNVPVFVESFAIWCPTCTRQQKEFKKFHESNPEIISITLDTDPNEDATAVKQHAEINSFDWRYSVSPADLTQGLIDEFGLGVVNAPAVPVILICPGKEVQLLGRGVKDQADLAVAVASCEV